MCVCVNIKIYIAEHMVIDLPFVFTCKIPPLHRSPISCIGDEQDFARRQDAAPQHSHRAGAARDAVHDGREAKPEEVRVDLHAIPGRPWAGEIHHPKNGDVTDQNEGLMGDL